jgi:hypothetical protein
MLLMTDSVADDHQNAIAVNQLNRSLGEIKMGEKERSDCGENTRETLRIELMFFYMVGLHLK